MAHRKDSGFRSDSKIGKCFQEVVRLYKGGLSLHELGEMFQIDHTNIYRALKSRGITIRNQGDGIRLRITQGRWPVKLGEKHPAWRGGKTKHTSGYPMIHNSEHPRANKRGYVFEHILVAERMLGRPLKHEETAHHINRIRDDNRPENLQIMNTKEHRRLHGIEGAQIRWNKQCPYVKKGR